MNQVLVLSTLLSVFALAFSSVPGHDNRYGNSHSRNSLSFQGRYPSAPQHPRGPHSQGHLQSPRLPQAPRHPQPPRAPAPHSYGGPSAHGSLGASSRLGGFGARQSAPGHYSGAPIHQSAPGHFSGGRHHQAAPVPFAGGRHLSPSGSSLNHYSGPSHYAGPVPYGGQVHASAAATQYASSERSHYQQPQAQASSYGHNSRSGHQPQNFAHSQQHAQATSTAHGREMKYTVRDPQNRGTTHVTETHVVSNKQMHGAEAEAAMKRLMGSMGPGSSSGGFDDFFKGMGLPLY